MEDQEPDKEFPTVLWKEKVSFCLLTLALTFYPLCLIISSILFSSRCGIENVDCKYYDKLEQVLGDEAFFMDVYDEDDQDAGLWLWNPFIHYFILFRVDLTGHISPHNNIRNAYFLNLQQSSLF